MAATSHVQLRQPIDMDIANRLAIDLCLCLHTNDLTRAKVLMENIGQEYKENTFSTANASGATLLMEACTRGLLHFAIYFIDECGADIDEHGPCDEHIGITKTCKLGDTMLQGATPLGCASMAGHVEVMHALLMRGASVNAMSRTKCTPLRMACFSSNLDAVELLCQYGADINTVDFVKGTPLMNSLRNVHIAHFLLEQGASLNAQDWIGNTALHYAIHNDRADAVELLLQYGADPRIQNEQGDDAFRTVSLLGKPAILNVLIQHSWADVSIQCQIESHELMGATFVDGMGDIQGALNEWNNAMLMRRKHKMMLSSDDVIPPRSVYGKQVEAITFEKFLPLEYTCDHERIHNQSLLIRERLLGLEHIATFSALLKRAASLADHRKYKRAAHTWCYAAKLRHHHGDRVAKDVIGAAQSMCTMFIEMDEEYMFDGADDYFCYKDAYSVFRVLCDEVEAAFQADATNQRDQPFCILVRYTLHLMSLLMNVSSKDEDVVLMRRVKQLVQKDVRLRDGSTMLHMAMDPFSNQLGKADKSYFPSDSIAELLLSCGANVNARDDRGNTPLHWFMDRLAATADLEPYVGLEYLKGHRLAMMLIDQGAHLDARNVDGVLACDPLRRIPEFQNQIPHKNAMGLKCLAARAIRAHNIPYMSEVPEALHEFIALH